MKTQFSIDNAMRDTFLTVLFLKQGAPIPNSGDLLRHCQQQVEQLKQLLTQQGLSQPDIEHILYAQCALLDETVLSHRKVDQSTGGDDSWSSSPLQAHYFHTMQAGDFLYQRIEQLLQQEKPNRYVATCFHRLLLLGFQGRYPLSSPERQKWLDKLATLAEPVTLDDSMTRLLSSQHSFNKVHHHHGLLLFILFSLAGLIGLWWALEHQLQSLLQALFPHW